MSRAKRKWCTEPITRSVRTKIDTNYKTMGPKDIVRKKWRERPQLSPPFNVQTIDDLLYIAWNYTGDAFDSFALWRMIPALTELQRMVGMNKLKTSIVGLIMYYIQGLHTGSKEGDMLHTVLMGCPGSGKTTVCHILAKIYCGLGFLTTEKVVVAKRSDFIGKYIGHSEAKTTELLEKARGGILFIDEAYSMGSKDKTDSFSKAVIDLLNSFLSENKKNFVCIIAGYEKELEESFFSINPGLERRFPWRFTIDPYDAGSLLKIFQLKVKAEMWSIADGAIDITFFEKNLSSFPFYGGDIEAFFSMCKVSHTRRIFGFTEGKKVLTKTDIESGFEAYMTHRKKDRSEDVPEFMYI